MLREIPMKIVVFGDNTLSQTHQVSCALLGVSPQENIVITATTRTIPYQNNAYSVLISPMTGAEGYERLRPIYYANVDLGVLAISLDSHAALEQMNSTWLAEFTHYAPGKPLMIIGLIPKTVENKDNIAAMRKAIDTNLKDSKKSVPHFNLSYLEVEIDTMHNETASKNLMEKIIQTHLQASASNASTQSLKTSFMDALRKINPVFPVATTTQDTKPVAPAPIANPIISMPAPVTIAAPASIAAPVPIASNEEDQIQVRDGFAEMREIMNIEKAFLTEGNTAIGAVNSKTAFRLQELASFHAAAAELLATYFSKNNQNDVAGMWRKVAENRHAEVAAILEQLRLEMPNADVVEQLNPLAHAINAVNLRREMKGQPVVKINKDLASLFQEELAQRIAKRRAAVDEKSEIVTSVVDSNPKPQPPKINYGRLGPPSAKANAKAAELPVAALSPKQAPQLVLDISTVASAQTRLKPAAPKIAAEPAVKQPLFAGLLKKTVASTDVKEQVAGTTQQFAAKP